MGALLGQLTSDGKAQATRAASDDGCLFEVSELNYYKLCGCLTLPRTSKDVDGIVSAEAPLA